MISGMHEAVYSLTQEVIEKHFEEEMPLLLADGAEIAQHYWRTNSAPTGRLPAATHSGFEGIAAEQVLLYVKIIAAFSSVLKAAVEMRHSSLQKPSADLVRPKIADALRSEGIDDNKATEIADESVQAVLAHAG